MNKLTSVVNLEQFLSTKWPNLVKRVDQIMPLCSEEKEKLESNLAARIVAVTPFIAQCPNPERLAISHLLTFIGSVRCRELFDPRPGESVRSRLESILHFPGGDQDAARACEYLLLLLSLNDHHKDKEEDLKNQRPNPITEGLRYFEEREKIIRLYDTLPENVKRSFEPFYSQVLFDSWWW